MKKVLTTLCLIHEDGKILLGMKKRGFGAGRWNGYGGKLEGEETFEENAIREIREESGIEILEMSLRGIMTFEFGNKEKTVEVHVFQINKFSGEPIETEEMKPQWFDVDKIPYDHMWSSDIHWMPLFLGGKKFKGTFLLDMPANPEHGSKVIKHDLEVVEEL